MARVTVRFYSLWQVYAGTASTVLEARDLNDLLQQVEERFGSYIREKLKLAKTDLSGRIEDFSLVLLNGTNIKQVESAHLKDGDVLHIMPPLAGG